MKALLRRAGVGCGWGGQGRAIHWWAALLSGLVLAACGGDEKAGDGGFREDGRYEVAEVSGHVDFGATGTPPGGMAGLKVRTGVGMADVGATGDVGTLIFETGPQFAELLDDQGRTVMLAFVSPESPDLSADSTARAIAYLALAGAWMKEEGRLKLLAEVGTLAGLPALRDAIQAQIAQQGYLDLAAGEIQSPLQTLVQEAYAPSASSVARSFAMVKPLGVIATPTTASGLSLDTSVESKLTIENVYLRRTSLFMRRTSHVEASGNEVSESNPFTRIDMDMVARYGGIIGTLDGYFKGEVAYSPVSTTVDIPRFPADAKRTDYEIFAIGPGGRIDTSLLVPAEILEAQQLIEIKALFLDAFLVLMANVALPLKGDQIDEYLKFASANAVITDLIGTLKSTLPTMWEQTANGDYYGALNTLFSSAYTSNTILPALGQLTLDFLWANTGINEDDYEMMFGGMKGMLDKMGKIDIGFTLADTFLLFRDVAVSNKVEQFLVSTTPGKVTLIAGSERITFDQTTTIDAVIQDKDPAGVYEYQWSVSPAQNYWVEDSSLNGSDDAQNGILVTGQSRVNVRSLSMSEGVATVHVEVLRLDGGRRQVGEGSVAITFQQNNRVETTHSDFRTEVMAVKQTNGQYMGVVGIYVDLPRSIGAISYMFYRRREGSISSWGFSENEPVVKNEYFEMSDTAPSAEARAALAGRAPAGGIRVWVEVDQRRGYATEADALLVAEQSEAGALAYAKQRPVSMTTYYP